MITFKFPSYHPQCEVLSVLEHYLPDFEGYVLGWMALLGIPYFHPLSSRDFPERPKKLVLEVLSGVLNLGARPKDIS